MFRYIFMVSLLKLLFVQGRIINLQRDPSKQGRLNASLCNPITSAHVNDDGTFYSFDAQFHCVNMYLDEGNCSGSFIRYHQFLKAENKLERHHWNEGGQYNRTLLVMKSIGPCFDKCDPRNWENTADPPSVPMKVLFYNEGRTTPTTMNVSEKGKCYQIYPPWKRRKSMQIFGINNSSLSSCIELHTDANCGGEFSQFRPGYVGLDKLQSLQLGFQTADKAYAVSLCGSFCAENKTNQQLTTTTARDELLNQHDGIVTIYDYSRYEGYDFNVTNCNPRLPTGAVYAIDSHGNCANLYSEENCKGNFIQASMLKDMTEPLTYEWENNVAIPKGYRVQSVGPCFSLDQCDPRNLQNVDDNYASVVLYHYLRYEGKNITVIVQGDECLPLPLNEGRWNSIRISVNNSSTSSCIELHQNPACDGKFTQFRSWYPNLGDLWDWATTPNLAKAISLCGKHCYKSITEFKPSSNNDIYTAKDGIVTIYQYPRFFGNSANLNLSLGCITLTRNPKNLTLLSSFESIRTYNTCVVLYAERNCAIRRGSYILETGRLSSQYYVEKLLSFTFPKKVNSLQACKKSEATGTENVRDTSVQQSEDGGLLCITNSIHIYIILYCLGIILISATLLGAYLAKGESFSAIRGECQGEEQPFHVIYNS